MLLGWFFSHITMLLMAALLAAPGALTGVAVYFLANKRIKKQPAWLTTARLALLAGMVTGIVTLVPFPYAIVRSYPLLELLMLPLLAGFVCSLAHGYLPTLRSWLTPRLAGMITAGFLLARLVAR